MFDDFFFLVEKFGSTIAGTKLDSGKNLLIQPKAAMDDNVETHN